MKELIRRTVRDYLANRAAGAFEASTITRMINLRGMLDRPVEEAEVEEALTFLQGLEQVAMVHGSLGASRHWKITSSGVLAHERGE